MTMHFEQTSAATSMMSRIASPQSQFENVITLDDVLPCAFVKVIITDSTAVVSPWTTNDCMYKNELPNAAEAGLRYQVSNSASTVRPRPTDSSPAAVLNLNSKSTR